MNSTFREKSMSWFLIFFGIVFMLGTMAASLLITLKQMDKK